MATSREDPYGAFHFTVEIEGVDVAGGFSEVSGLGLEIEPVEYRTGADGGAVRKIPGIASYPNVVLRRGVIGDLSLWEWIKATADGAFQKRSMVISMCDERREPVLRFKLFEAWPCAFRGPGLRAGTSEIAIEELEICYEKLEVE